MWCTGGLHAKCCTIWCTYLLLLVRATFLPFSFTLLLHLLLKRDLIWRSRWCDTIQSNQGVTQSHMFVGIKQLHGMCVIWWSLVASNQASPWSTFQSNWLGSIVITSSWPTLVMDLIFYYILACMYWSAPWAVCDVMEPGRKQPGSITIYIPVKLNNNLSNKMDF